MLYFEMGLSWIAEFLALLPVILAVRTAGNTAFCLGAGTALWLLEWYMARPVPESAAAEYAEKAGGFRRPYVRDRQGRTGGGYADKSGSRIGKSGPKRAPVCGNTDSGSYIIRNILYGLCFWALLAQAAVFLRLAADLLAEAFLPGASAALLCFPVLSGALLTAAICQGQRERGLSRGRTVKLPGVLAVLVLTCGLMLPAAAALSVSAQPAEAEAQEFAMLDAADAVFQRAGISAGKTAIAVLALGGMLFSAAAAYLGLQRILTFFCLQRMRRTVPGFWPAAIVFSLLLAAGFRGWTSVAGWYCAYALQVLAPVMGGFAAIYITGSRAADCA